MKNKESFLNKVFIVASVWLLVTILLGFFILPSVSETYDRGTMNSVLTFIVVSSGYISIIAAIVVVCLAIVIPVLKLIRKPVYGLRSPSFIAATALFIGLVCIFLHALYVKLRTCPIDGSDAWYCQVEGKSYVGMLVLVFLLASLVGCTAWAVQKLAKKK